MPSTYRPESAIACARDPDCFAPKIETVMGMSGYTHGVRLVRTPPAKAIANAASEPAASCLPSPRSLAAPVPPVVASPGRTRTKAKVAAATRMRVALRIVPDLLLNRKPLSPRSVAVARSCLTGYSERLYSTPGVHVSWTACLHVGLEDRQRDEDSHLHGLSRHDPRRPARARSHAPVFPGGARERRLEEPRLRVARRGGGRGGPGGGGKAHRRLREGDRLHERRDRVGQPRGEGRRPLLQGQGASPRHLQDGAQGGARLDAPAG